MHLPEEHTTGPSALAKAPRLRRIPITVPFWLAVPKTKQKTKTTHSTFKSAQITYKIKTKYYVFMNKDEEEADRGLTQALTGMGWLLQQL